MAKDDARYTGSFFNSYTNTRMKLHRHCVPLEDDAEKIAAIYGYPLAEVDQIFEELETELTAAADTLQRKFGRQLAEKLENRTEQFVFIGDQMTSEYLSYYNILKRLFAKFSGISVSIAGNTGDNSNQSLQYIYGLAVSKAPTVTSILIGTNDAFCTKDAYRKTVASRTEFAANVDYLTKVMLHHGSKVILHTLPPVDTKAAERAYAHMNWTITNEEIDARNQIILDIARKNKCQVSDIAACLKKQGMAVNLPGNGVLLTGQAQLVIAGAFLETLLAQL